MITKTNASLIDHILTNDFITTDSSAGIVENDISDNFPIYVIRIVQFLNNTQYQTTISKRKLNKKSKQ